MFNFLKNKIKIRTLQKKFEMVMQEWQKIPKTNRKENEKKKAEAVRILKELEMLKI